MPVSTPVQPKYSGTGAQTGTAYPLAIDAAIAAASRLAWAFAPHEQSTPDMTMRLEAGFVRYGSTASEVAAQSTAAFTAPAANPRIDRVVIDRRTGVVSIVIGTEAASPMPPAVPAGTRRIAQVLLQTSSIAITNSMITDERTGDWDIDARARNLYLSQTMGAL